MDEVEPDGPPRLVATDLDGTLVHSDGTVTARTRAVLERLEARGVPVVFVTGRPLRWTVEVFEHVGEHGLAVVSNGGLVWNVHERRVELERTIAPVTGLEVARRLRAAVPGSAFAGKPPIAGSPKRPPPVNVMAQPPVSTVSSGALFAAISRSS